MFSPTGTLATVRGVGRFADPPNPWSHDQPALLDWWMDGGDFPGFDTAAQRMGGWSVRALREMAATFGTAVLNEPLIDATAGAGLSNIQGDGIDRQKGT